VRGFLNQEKKNWKKEKGKTNENASVFQELLEFSETAEHLLQGQ
jgi:hypothetical protein